MFQIHHFRRELINHNIYTLLHRIYCLVFRPRKNVMDVKKGKLQQVIELSKAELAQNVAMLQLQLAEKEDVIEKLKMTIGELQAEHAKNKAEYESTVVRHQQFIDKVSFKILCNLLFIIYGNLYLKRNHISY